MARQMTLSTELLTAIILVDERYMCDWQEDTKKLTIFASIIPTSSIA
jgi:hypothetical protein